MADLIPQERKPEHLEIHLQLLEMDVPALKRDAPILRTSLPLPVVVSAEAGALVVRIPDSEKSIELRAADIPGVALNGWSNCFYRATIELRDPYEVVDHFNIVIGSEEQYWIKAFAKMCKEKLEIAVTSEEPPF